MRALVKSDLLQHVFFSRNAIIQTVGRFVFSVGNVLLGSFVFAAAISFGKVLLRQGCGTTSFHQIQFSRCQVRPLGYTHRISWLFGLLWDDQGSMETSLAETSVLT